MFTLSLYDNSLVPRNIVQTVVDGINAFLENAYQPFIKQKLNSDLKVSYQSLNSDNLSAQIDTILDSVPNPFRTLDSEYKRFECFKQNSSYSSPTKYFLGLESAEKKC